MPYVPGKKFQRFMDWTVRVTMVHEPDRPPRRYDFWFGGFVAGFLLGTILWNIF